MAVVGMVMAWLSVVLLAGAMAAAFYGRPVLCIALGAGCVFAGAYAVIVAGLAW